MRVSGGGGGGEGLVGRQGRGVCGGGGGDGGGERRWMIAKYSTDVLHADVQYLKDKLCGR